MPTDLLVSSPLQNVCHFAFLANERDQCVAELRVQIWPRIGDRIASEGLEVVGRVLDLLGPGDHEVVAATACGGNSRHELRLPDAESANCWQSSRDREWLDPLGFSQVGIACAGSRTLRRRGML